MEKLLECVPNFSEGRNLQIIEKIASSIKHIHEVNLLHVDSGFSVNRTVMTFLGPPDLVIEAAFQAIKTAGEEINMEEQIGSHPRIGATDVCPLIPLKGLTFEEANSYALRLAERVGKELSIPTYLYEFSSKYKHRRKLADIRRGGYENFSEKMKLSEWKPDYGPYTFNPKTGATVVGVRKILVAFNINLNTDDPKIASKIASQIREGGNNGLFGVRAIGWFIPEFKFAQVSLNITDYKATPIYQVFERCKDVALNYGVLVTGSELIGMIPKDALIESGRYYAIPHILDDEYALNLGIEKLGLNINKQERILIF